MFRQFLVGVRQSRQRDCRHEPLYHDDNRSRRRRLFKKGAPYNVMLSSQEHNITGEKMTNNRGMASLLYISFMLEETSHSPTRTAALLRRRSTLLIDHNLDTDPRPRLLTFVLYRDTEEVITNVRFWWLVHAMRMVRRLTHDICNLLKSVFLDELRLEDLAHSVHQRHNLDSLSTVIRESISEFPVT